MDKILPIDKEWQQRPLKSIYTVVFLDAIHYHVRTPDSHPYILSQTPSKMVQKNQFQIQHVRYRTSPQRCQERRCHTS